MDFERFQRRWSITAAAEARTSTTWATIYGLTCHAHELVRSGFLRVDPGSISTAPIARSVFEAGVTAQWLRWQPDADLALLRKRRREQLKLTEDLQSSPLEGQRAAGARRRQSHVEPEIPRTSVQEPDTSFRAICMTFEQGTELYVYYRVLCGQMHAGVEAAETWLEVDEKGELHVRRTPKEVGRLAWPYLTLLGVLWASRALDDVIRPSTRGNFLNRVAKDAKLPAAGYETRTRLTPRR